MTKEERYQASAEDIQKIQAAGYNISTPVIISNTDDYKSVTGLKTGSIRRMEPLIRVEEV